MNKILSAPMNAILSITNNCNLKCLHCFSSSSACDGSLLEYENWKKIIPILVKSKIFSVRYSGGEPLSVPWFKDIAEEVASNKINSGMNTNATLVTPSVASWMSKLPMRESIIVGIDGLQDSHEKLRGKGTFNNAMRGIQLLVDNGLNVEMFCVITQLNYKEIPEIYRLSKEIGVKKINFNKLCLVGRSTTNESKLVLSKQQQKYVYDTLWNLDDNTGYIKGVLFNEMKLYRDYISLSAENNVCNSTTIGCGNGSNGIVIYSNGDCSPCEMLGRRAICGNLLSDNFSVIWKNSRILNEFRELSNMSVECIEGCKDCKIKDRCGGTCRAEPYINGSILGKGSICIKEIFEA